MRAGLIILAALTAAAAGCGTLKTERAALNAAKAEHPSCPEEQLHLVGRAETEGCVYEVDVCGRRRFYKDEAADCKARQFTRTTRPGAGNSQTDRWAEHDGVAPSSGGQAAPPTSDSVDNGQDL